MPTPRLDFRRRPKGPVLLTLFGAEIQAGQVRAEAAFVASLIPRPVFMQCDGLKVRVQPVRWTGFSVERPFLDQILIEVQNGKQA